MKYLELLTKLEKKRNKLMNKIIDMEMRTINPPSLKLTAYTSSVVKHSEEYYLKEIAWYSLRLSRMKWWQNKRWLKAGLKENCECLHKYYWTGFFDEDNY